MVMKLTFKQYLASKEALREAVKQTPRQSKTYQVNRYCNFVVGESKLERQTINLRPTSCITVEWLYEDIDHPIATKINFDGVKNIDPIDDMVPGWSSAKILKWLTRNTTD